MVDHQCPTLWTKGEERFKLLVSIIELRKITFPLTFYRNISFGNFAHIEANCWYHILAELTRLKSGRKIKIPIKISVKLVSLCCKQRQFRPKKSMNWRYRCRCYFLFLSKLNDTHRDDIDKCGFPWVLQTNQCQFHFLFPKETFEPVQNTVNYRQHFEWNAEFFLGWVFDVYSVLGSTNRLSSIQLNDKKNKTNDDDDDY